MTRMSENNSSQPDHHPVVLITGGTSGIGLATAILFASNGYRVAICGRNQGRLEEAIKTITPAAGPSNRVAGFESDLNDPQNTKALHQSVIERFGSIDVLVNNASSAPLGDFESMSAETFESMLNINVRSVFYLTQLAWRTMQSQSRGVVVNISSLAAIDPFPGFSLYGSSKAWLDILTHVLAAEGEASGIRVYSIRPGAVETPMLRGLFPDFPADQCVQPEEVARFILRCVHEPEQVETGKPHHVTNQADHS